jgi:hypothetical protein
MAKAGYNSKCDVVRRVRVDEAEKLRDLSLELESLRHCDGYQRKIVSLDVSVCRRKGGWEKHRAR